MQRIHLMLNVANLEESISFYSHLLGHAPTTQKEDYAKWLLDDPRVNLSIKQDATAPGLNHLGIQAENEEELQQLYGRLEASQAAVAEEGHTICCYAQSEKSWTQDPQGLRWEAFRTYGESETYRQEINDSTTCCPEPSTCCTPAGSSAVSM